MLEWPDATLLSRLQHEHAEAREFVGQVPRT